MFSRANALWALGFGGALIVLDFVTHESLLLWFGVYSIARCARYTAMLLLFPSARQINPPNDHLGWPMLFLDVIGVTIALAASKAPFHLDALLAILITQGIVALYLFRGAVGRQVPASGLQT